MTDKNVAKTGIENLVDFFVLYIDDKNFRIDVATDIVKALEKNGLSVGDKASLITNAPFQMALVAALVSIEEAKKEMAVAMASAVAGCLPSYDFDFTSNYDSTLAVVPPGFSVGNTVNFSMKAESTYSHGVSQLLASWYWADENLRSAIKVQISDIKTKFKAIADNIGNTTEQRYTAGQIVASATSALDLIK